MKILMFSGGMDSTYLSWKLLKENTKGVHLHYVSIRNDCENIWKKEDIVTERIIGYFKVKNFDFIYSTSKFEFFGFGQCGFDSDLLLLVAQKLAINCRDKYIEVLLGWNPHDMERQEIADRSERHVTSNIWRALVESCWNRERINKELQFPLIDENITKKQMFEEMPRELSNLTWSCRHGIDEPCGNCHSCLERKLISSS